MKKLLLLAAVLLVSGCATRNPQCPPEPQACYLAPNSWALLMQGLGNEPVGPAPVWQPAPAAGSILNPVYVSDGFSDGVR